MRKPHSSGRIPVHFRYKDLAGVKRQKTVYGSTEKEALRNKQDFLNAVKMCLRVDEQGRTVAAWAEEWIATYKKPTVAAKTLESYQHDTDLLVDALGARPLKSVTQAELQRLINTRKGMSESAISKTAMTVKAIFQAALDNRLIQFNPALGVKPPKGTSGTHRALTLGEISSVHSACKAGDKLALPIMLMLFAGLRRGEAIGFNPATDVAGGMLHVRRNVSWPVNQPVLKLPKSAAGVRSIPIFNQIKPFLVLQNKLLSKTMLNDALADFVGACGVAFTPHDLRHTFCTLLYDAGVDVKTAQLWMGHSDASVTMRIYTHLSQTKQSASTVAAVEYFEGLGGNIGNIENADTPNDQQNQHNGEVHLPDS